MDVPITQIELTLPYPPTINHYLKRSGSKTYLSAQARGFRCRVKIAWMEAGRPSFEKGSCLKLELYIYHPDKRRRDISNLIKITEDAMQGYLFDDDYNIFELHVYRMPELLNKCRAVLTKLN